MSHNNRELGHLNNITNIHIDSLLRPKELVAYTNGSKTETRVGARIYGDKSIHICSDSQVVLRALKAYEEVLSRLSCLNHVAVLGASGHLLIEGNKRADILTRRR